MDDDRMKYILNTFLYLFAAIGVLNTGVMAYVHFGRPLTCTQSAMAKANAPDNSQWAEISWQQCDSQADPELRLTLYTNGGKRGYSTRIGDPTQEFPEWVQPIGAHDAYAAGSKVSHNEKKWVSDIDGTVWEPGVYGWTEYTE